MKLGVEALTLDLGRPATGWGGAELGQFRFIHLADVLNKIFGAC
jgi:hypothetical protein